ncbi:hypothetical protein N431DRAFT_447071 [Stipitochalara longipes BDJ]|nr:hypothetical protein N431DRAFT_447071 [Stipitochalara longipes BDJ]
MSSVELIGEILALASGLDSFNNFQILNVNQDNSLFAFAPQLVEFSQGCGSDLQQLLELSQSSIFNNILESNIDLAGSLTPCLEQVLGLEQLLGSGQDLQLSNNNDINNNNNLNNSSSVEASNSTASVSSASNSTAAANVTEANNQQQNNKDQNKNDNKDDKNKDKAKKNGKRGDVVQRSGASKKQVLGGFGLGLMVVVGAFAL